VTPGGILLVVIGTWVVSQVLGGNALERLNVLQANGSPQTPGPVQAPGLSPDPGGITQNSGEGPGGTVSQPQGTKKK